HRTAFALGIAVLAPGQLSHDALRVHAAGEHMTVVTIASDDLVAVLEGHLHADDHGLLADIKVAKSTDQAHSVHLTGLLFEAPDQQHLPVSREFLLFCQWWNRGGGFSLRCRRIGAR